MNDIHSKSKEIILVGAGGHVRPIIDIARLNGFQIIGIIDPAFKSSNEYIFDVPVIGGEQKFIELKSKANVFIAIGDNNSRAYWYNLAVSLGYNIQNLIHPTAIISSLTTIGKGVLINAGAIINAGVRIDSGCIINTGVIVDHESEIESFVHLAPGAIVAGRVKIGTQTFLGIGTTVIDKINIGAHVISGANSIIIKDITAGSKIVGVSKSLK